VKQAYWHCNASKWHCDPHIGKLGMRKWTAQYAQVPISTSRSRQRVGIVSVCLMRLLATWSATMLRYSLQDQFPRSTHTPHFPCESSLITFPPPSRPVAATTEDDLSNGVSGKAFFDGKMDTGCCALCMLLNMGECKQYARKMNWLYLGHCNTFRHCQITNGATLNGPCSD
jgi:hypothetical protein